MSLFLLGLSVLELSIGCSELDADVVLSMLVLVFSDFSFNVVSSLLLVTALVVCSFVLFFKSVLAWTSDADFSSVGVADKILSACGELLAGATVTLLSLVVLLSSLAKAFPPKNIIEAIAIEAVPTLSFLIVYIVFLYCSMLLINFLPFSIKFIYIIQKNLVVFNIYWNNRVLKICSLVGEWL